MELHSVGERWLLNIEHACDKITVPATPDHVFHELLLCEDTFWVDIRGVLLPG
jgi:hypothetical protein